jgi:3-oxoacyl-[acyl-carrier protein] reductase
MDLGLCGRTALVAASSKGLGLATARELLREGANVMINGHDGNNLAAAAETLYTEFSDQPDLRERLATHQADLADAAEAASLAQAAAARFGGLDILVTNNGGPPVGAFDTTDDAAWRRGIDLTLMSAVALIRAALPHLERSTAGSILTITSISVKMPIAGLHLSNVIRPAVAGLTKSLSQELGPRGIRVNSLLPGTTATERMGYLLGQRAAAAGTTVEQEADKVARAIPLGRMGTPEEFGRMAAFMVSPAASYLNGVMLQLDGGAYSGLI